MIELVFLLLMGLAWGIGGEPGFGKWKRGALLVIPLTGFGIYKGIAWYFLIGQGLGLLLLYQCLFYGMAIRILYVEEKELLGYFLIVLNGLLIGLTCVFFGIWSLDIALILTGLITGILGFIIIVKLSNESRFRFIWDWCYNNLPWKFKDFWFTCECVMGLLLGIALLIS